ncbi:MULTISPECIES: site-specific integrase [Rhodopseudomonas]|uniref:Tyr recombinase domain-containing protein n=1 Tax=Rhodopseudomonas palustris TaxID=1076 RepID=A0A0D7F438_RHOPL|nr:MULTISPECIES: site-specific integrase [Rhodopseudomonas]KIZ47838.1 hypothetical protein OO17_02155 [Rhodopseudomonas palustris]MDF3811041.1 site-specific integrase [Rhodopseudomonas sp. BAL398]WOK15937.1 site-specific integrase [Rhodopseudomonas sp. BAL398]
MPLRAEDLDDHLRPGRYADGGNLYFVVGRKGERRWAFVYKSRVLKNKAGTGKTVELGLGGAPYRAKEGVSLAEARRRAKAARRLLEDGKDPLIEKRAAAVAAVAVVKAEVAAATTFGGYCDAFVARKTEEFGNPVHRRQWESTMATYCAPLRTTAIQDIDTAAVLGVLEPIWTRIPETASRVRARLEKVLSAATVDGLRTGDNPARWVNHLEFKLSARKGSDVKNHAALGYADMPGFMVELRKLTSVSARALEFAILTAARTGETIGATWSEIDVKQRLWIIPADRMKASKEHRVPLTERVIEILQDIRKISKTKPTDYVFQSSASGRGLSNMALLQCLRGIRAGVTTHGMRSAFRDWAGDQTKHDQETIEFSLAHVKGDKAEAAYRRGTALDKRRALLVDWESYLAGRVTL